MKSPNKSLLIFVHIRRVLIVWLISIGLLLLSGGLLHAQSLTAPALRGALEQTVRKLDSCHLVAVTRYNPKVQSASSDSSRVEFLDLWLSGDHAQFRTISGNGAKSSWWENSTFTVSSSPLTASNVDSVPGVKECVRPDGEFCWAKSSLVKPHKNMPFPSLYSLSKKSRPVSIFTPPLVDLNRNWRPKQHRGQSFVLNFLLDAPVESWRVIGPKEIHGFKTVLVEIPKQGTLVGPVKGYKETFSFTPLWKVWFSVDPDKGYFPLKMETSVRYEFGGKEFYVERPSTSPAVITYEGYDIAQFGEGLWYPRAGREEMIMHVPDNSFSYKHENLVKLFLRDGKVFDDGKCKVATRREWHVLELKEIEPTDDLWFDAPKNACVHNEDTNARFIEGLSEEESKMVLETGVKLQRDFPSRRVFIIIFVITSGVLTFRLVRRYLTHRRARG
jgi:hypothetical protein